MTAQERWQNAREALRATARSSTVAVIHQAENESHDSHPLAVPAAKSMHEDLTAVTSEQFRVDDGRIINVAFRVEELLTEIRECARRNLTGATRDFRSACAAAEIAGVTLEEATEDQARGIIEGLNDAAGIALLSQFDVEAVFEVIREAVIDRHFDRLTREDKRNREMETQLMVAFEAANPEFALNMTDEPELTQLVCVLRAVESHGVAIDPLIKTLAECFADHCKYPQNLEDLTEAVQSAFDENLDTLRSTQGFVDVSSDAQRVLDEISGPAYAVELRFERLPIG